MIGRRGGAVLSTDALTRVEKKLLRNRVQIKPNSDQLLAGKAALGLFRPYRDNSATIFLRSDPTTYELLHELKHYRHFLQVVKNDGIAAYRLWNRVMTPLEKEQYVYDALRRSHRWATFTADEVKHSQLYITRLGGTAW